MPYAHHNLFRALMLSSTVASTPRQAAGAVCVQPDRQQRTRASPLRRGEFFKAHLVGVALLQLLTGAFAAPLRHLAESGGFSGNAGAGARAGQSSGQIGEEEVSGVYGEVVDGGEDGGGDAGSGFRASREPSRPAQGGTHSCQVMRCKVLSRCLALPA